jgi:alpha-D-ribose 1-methylphosphonate 5-phosphate C-P lyase
MFSNGVGGGKGAAAVIGAASVVTVIAGGVDDCLEHAARRQSARYRMRDRTRDPAGAFQES